MHSVQKPRATYQDVLDSPEHMVAEIINGELRLSNRPAGPGYAVAAAILDELGPLCRGPNGPGDWLLLHEPALHLGDEIVVPDLAAWRRDRLPASSDVVAAPGRFITVPPDWVCEVLSKATEKTDRAEKMPIYAMHGVMHAWLAHPRWRTIEAFRIVEGKWLASAIHSDADRARIEPFDAIELDVARLWMDAPLPARASELAQVLPGALQLEAH